ncbi:MAG: hypothetical protein RIK87_12285 [Fuerstiella sp.]
MNQFALLRHISILTLTIATCFFGGMKSRKAMLELPLFLPDDAVENLR